MKTVSRMKAVSPLEYMFVSGSGCCLDTSLWNTVIMYLLLFQSI